MTDWATLKEAAALMSAADRRVSGLLAARLLRHDNLTAVLAHRLVETLAGEDLPARLLGDVLADIWNRDPSLLEAAGRDLEAIVERDPACAEAVTPLLFFNGYLALQGYRLAHHLHAAGRETLAFLLQAQISARLQVDIHPGAEIGRGVFIDHGCGVVIGETAVVGDDVTILQGVTLGGTGTGQGRRHPRIGVGVLLSADATVLGAISVGDHAKVAAGSLVFQDVPAGCTAVGAPARLVNCAPMDGPAI